jgi:hypothetical protein
MRTTLNLRWSILQATLEVASSLGLTFPQTMFATADEVIE